tara:strand:- start:870 stop:1043 length:174 start_codon:yes stop_codon:yes gene_type:complete
LRADSSVLEILADWIASDSTRAISLQSAPSAFGNALSSVLTSVARTATFADICPNPL